MRKSQMVSKQRVSGGFSLVELLVVIVIIAIVISLLLPALGGARDIAKAATTQSVVKEFGNAIDRFRQDKAGFRPGVFSEAQMGASENADVYGFTAQENIMLELAGGLVFDDGSGGNVLKTFGPTQAAHDENAESGQFVREDLIGAEYEGNPGYFQPDAKFFVAQTRPEGQFGSGAGVSAGEANIPDLVDAWGNPLLVWVEDGQSPPVVDNILQFAREDSGTGNSDEFARFYWAANAGYLKATELGGGGQDQTFDARRQHSLIGGGVDPTRIVTSITGLLGNPASPLQDLSSSNANNLLPASSRSAIVVQSAGTNGIFMGSRERASKIYNVDARGLRYGLTYYLPEPRIDVRRKDSSGAMGTANLVDDFDDIILSFGN